MEARTLPAPARVRAEHPFVAAAAGVFAATLCAFLAVGAVLPVLPRSRRSSPRAARPLPARAVVATY